MLVLRCLVAEHLAYTPVVTGLEYGDAHTEVFLVVEAADALSKVLEPFGADSQV